jgi:hypothetical protein
VAKKKFTSLTYAGLGLVPVFSKMVPVFINALKIMFCEITVLIGIHPLGL